MIFNEITKNLLVLDNSDFQKHRLNKHKARIPMQRIQYAFF